MTFSEAMHICVVLGVAYILGMFVYREVFFWPRLLKRYENEVLAAHNIAYARTHPIIEVDQ